jgi:predicted house-cleaning noncanonical NTP pyrophosphatase (MazG superfamily)
VTETWTKLIRDRVPILAATRGEILPTRVADPAEMPALLRNKLGEEIGEFLAAGTPTEQLTELADVLEVVYALAKLAGCGPSGLHRLCMTKVLARGGFEGRLVWSGEVEKRHDREEKP